jgi:hypothetical protein
VQNFGTVPVVKINSRRKRRNGSGGYSKACSVTFEVFLAGEPGQLASERPRFPDINDELLSRRVISDITSLSTTIFP